MILSSMMTKKMFRQKMFRSCPQAMHVLHGQFRKWSCVLAIAIGFSKPDWVLDGEQVVAITQYSIALKNSRGETIWRAKRLRDISPLSELPERMQRPNRT
jgi:hypothetical protein